jgi:uncharacterized repeat protein (TIGR03803 family)
LIHSFAGGADGAGPSGLIAVNGVLYGTTASGGAYHYGTVFSLTTAGVHRVIYNFAGEGYGLAPQALTSLHGTLYGTTTYGGSGPCATNGHKGCGTVFAVTLAGSESVIHEFRGGADGAYPEAGLTAVGGTLYGTTSQGGLGLAPGPGTIFEITFGK